MNCYYHFYQLSGTKLYYVSIVTLLAFKEINRNLVIIKKKDSFRPSKTFVKKDNYLDNPHFLR